jgi:FixJ family two-component response regulator
MTELGATVFIVDDDDAVRRSLLRLLKSAGFRTASFGSADEFLDFWNGNPLPGCVLLDLSLPGLNGLQLQQQLHSSANAIPIIFITGHGDIPSTVTAMKAGAVDFFPKPFNDEDLLQAVREAIRRDTRQRAERAERAAFERHFQALTPREREVMALVVKGFPNKQIASALGASEKTVKIHRGRVMDKMSVQSVADLVRAAEKIGLALDASTRKR